LAIEGSGESGDVCGEVHFDDKGLFAGKSFLNIKQFGVESPPRQHTGSKDPLPASYINLYIAKSLAFTFILLSLSPRCAIAQCVPFSYGEAGNTHARRVVDCGIECIVSEWKVRGVYIAVSGACLGFWCNAGSL